MGKDFGNKRRFDAKRVVAAAAAAFAVVLACVATGFSGTPAPSLAKAASTQVEAPAVQVDQIPAYDGSPSTALNGNRPYFDAADYGTESFEAYSPHDSLGRCQSAMALVGTDIMPTEERGRIGQVKPTGWHLVKYAWIDGKYLYNRCHLIGYQLSGENANDCNLITGTRYLNIEGMQPYENQVASYVKKTGNHVLYRVTPVFEGDDLLARGVVMEAESVEDGGAGIGFCVFCYNVQPGVSIDYATGDNAADATMGEASSQNGEGQVRASQDDREPSYVLNTNTKKFHYPWCSSVKDMSPKNKKPFYGTHDEAVEEGYVACRRCNP